MFKKSVLVFVMMFVASSLMAKNVVTKDGVHWAKDYQSGIAQAKKEHKPVLFIISRDTCKYCVLLDDTTLKNPTVVQMLNKDFVAIRSWTNEKDYIPMDIAQNTPGLPGIWFLYSDGTPMYQPLLGYVKEKDFMQALAIVKTEFDKQNKQVETK